MVRKLVVFTLLSVMLGSPVFASNFTDSASRAVSREVAAQRQRRQAQADNPYKTPSTVLMVGGGLLLLYGAMHETGIKCSETDFFDCKATHSTATILTGGAMAGVGTLLFMKGQKSPAIGIGPSGVSFRRAVRW